MEILERFIAFIIEHFPSLMELGVVAPISMFVCYGILYGAGSLKLKKGVPTAYTRKIVHFSVFVGVAILQSIGGISLVFAFGIGAGITILYALVKGKGHVLYEAVARKRDAPYQTWLIIIPFCCTVLGGLLGNFYFGEAAIFGYLVAGIGDGIGEPIGRKFGKTNFWNSKKTLEGTTAVFLGSIIAIHLGSVLTGADIPIMFVFLSAAIFSIVELISPRGVDNFFMQLIPTATLVTFL